MTLLSYKQKTKPDYVLYRFGLNFESNSHFYQSSHSREGGNLPKNRQDSNRVSIKNISSKGMTLLEMIVALGLFAFMFAFIAQMVKQNHRQVQKIRRDVQWKSSLFNALDLMRHDFRGVAYFLDMNENMGIHFPMVQDKEDSLSSSY